jgi:hypothetical protein
VKLSNLSEDSNWTSDQISDLMMDQVLQVDRQLLQVARASRPVEISGEKL